MAFSFKFWKDAFERAISTFAQTFIGAGIVLPGDFFQGETWGVAVVAAALSIFKSLAASQIGEKDSASLVN